MIFFEADLSDHHAVLHRWAPVHVRYDYTMHYTINIIYHAIDHHGNPSHATYNKSRYLVCFDNIRCYYVLHYNVMFKIKIKTNGRAILNDNNTVSVNVKTRLFTLLDI